MELDLTIIMDNVPTITKTSSEVDKTLYEAWERSNRLSLSLMEMSIYEPCKKVFLINKKDEKDMNEKRKE
ncbi:hypothetical protein Lal_00016344 [Lupinus albus]|nr:hypothetical protein Lal_00016344 [Lupinus albus]